MLYRGCVAEIGDVEKVIKEPKHPYTQLLVESIPQPDPEKRWGPNSVAFADHGSNEKNRGCKFTVACPFVIPDLCQIPPPSSVSRQSQPCRPLFSLPACPRNSGRGNGAGIESIEGIIHEYAKGEIMLLSWTKTMTAVACLGVVFLSIVMLAHTRGETTLGRHSCCLWQYQQLGHFSWWPILDYVP